MAQRHMKLSDVEGAKNYILREPATFARAFPAVSEIRVEIRPTGEGFEPMFGQKEWLDVYNMESIPMYYNCRNPRCYGGGVDLHQLIRWHIVERKIAEFEDSFSCSGHEGSPKGRKKYGSCDSYFKVKITARYRDLPA